MTSSVNFVCREYSLRELVWGPTLDPIISAAVSTRSHPEITCHCEASNLRFTGLVSFLQEISQVFVALCAAEQFNFNMISRYKIILHKSKKFAKYPSGH